MTSLEDPAISLRSSQDDDTKSNDCELGGALVTALAKTDPVTTAWKGRRRVKKFKHHDCHFKGATIVSLDHQCHSSLTARAARALLFRYLREMQGGRLTIREGSEVWQFGAEDTDLTATITVNTGRMYRRMLSGGELGVAATLMDGDWSCDDLTSLVRIAIRSSDLTSHMERGWGWLSRLAGRIVHAWRRNTPRMARRNIHRHYDLGNEFYELWLDPTMSYSSAIFASPRVSLREASEAKMQRACDSLALQPDDHLLEIGTGWGGLAVFAAQNYGCRVTTTTISQQQYRAAQQRVQQAGLEHRITVLQQDYRDLSGTFDKLVSIEMIEAIGHQYFDTFFRKCGQLLRPDGMLLLQAIVITDRKYRSYLQSTDFIRHYIFPGGCLPSISTLIASASNAARMRPLLLEDLAGHYAETLRRWRQSFHASLEDVVRLGFDERFVRMWDYYLAYCEAAFLERQVNDIQLLLAGHECRFDPMTQIKRLPISESFVQMREDSEVQADRSRTHADSGSSATGGWTQDRHRPYPHQASTGS